MPRREPAYYVVYYMGTRTVRLDDEAERLLSEIRAKTGTTITGALKRGLQSAARELREQPARRPWDVYQTIDLGPGGYAKAPARRAKQAIASVLRRNRR